MKNYLCIDIGGTSVKYGIYSEESGFLMDSNFPTQAWLGGHSIIDRIIKLASQILEKQTDICGICISTAGMVDCNTGCITYASSLIPEYTGTPVKNIFEQQFHLPCEVENDVNCAALAEYFSGAAQGASSCLCLTIGTGIGGAFVENGQIFHGFSGSGCEVGYMYLPDGAFQDIASTSALVRRVARRKNLSFSALSGKKIFDLAKKNDSDCIEEIDRMTSYLGMGIANICYVLNPEIIVLGGGIMVQKELLYDKIREAVDKYLLHSIAGKTTLKFAQNQNRAGMLGAFYHFKARKKEADIHV